MSIYIVRDCDSIAGVYSSEARAEEEAKRLNDELAARWPDDDRMVRANSYDVYCTEVQD